MSEPTSPPTGSPAAEPYVLNSNQTYLMTYGGGKKDQAEIERLRADLEAGRAVWPGRQRAQHQPNDGSATTAGPQPAAANVVVQIWRGMKPRQRFWAIAGVVAALIVIIVTVSNGGSHTFKDGDCVQTPPNALTGYDIKGVGCDTPGTLDSPVSRVVNVVSGTGTDPCYGQPGFGLISFQDDSTKTSYCLVPVSEG